MMGNFTPTGVLSDCRFLRIEIFSDLHNSTKHFCNWKGLKILYDSFFKQMQVPKILFAYRFRLIRLLHFKMPIEKLKALFPNKLLF